jgi:cytochrome c peroxidase
MQSAVRGAGLALGLALIVSLLVAPAPAAGPKGGDAPYEWRLPPGFPAPRVPAGNPMTAAKVELGRHLFYERRLSIDGSYACASCHRQSLAFTDGRPRALGATGQLHPRSAMSLANAAYEPVLGWDDPDLRRLEDQARVPMLNEHPIEMGLKGRERAVLARLRADPVYARLFADAFPGVRRPVYLPRTVQALASFERTLISGGSAFDRWLYAAGSLADGELRGMRLFFSARLGCSGCHGGFNLSGPTVYAGSGPAEPLFHNTGLYDLDGRGAYPADNPGLFRFTRRAADMGGFRAPTLRNVALTAPYMHDGSIATLSEVIDHYAAGGRTASPRKSSRLTGFQLTPEEKRDLLDFLASLTDEGFLRDPRFGDPWEGQASGEPAAEP